MTGIYNAQQFACGGYEGHFIKQKQLKAKPLTRVLFQTTTALYNVTTTPESISSSSDSPLLCIRFFAFSGAFLLRWFSNAAVSRGSIATISAHFSNQKPLSSSEPECNKSVCGL